MADKIVYIALGSNVGDRAAMLERAIVAMNSAGIRVLRQSSFYVTQPFHAPGQAWFLNAVVEAETSLLPLQLLHALLRIERELGRRRITPHGPRTIDLDILLFGDVIVNDLELTIPHPAMQYRRFALEPLVEIAPDAVHPVLKKTVRELLIELAPGQSVRRIESNANG